MRWSVEWITEPITVIRERAPGGAQMSAPTRQSDRIRRIAIHIRFARSLISILRCSYFIGANKTDSWIWEMHNEYRIYGWRRARSAADMSRVIW